MPKIDPKPLNKTEQTPPIPQKNPQKNSAKDVYFMLYLFYQYFLLSFHFKFLFQFSCKCISKYPTNTNAGMRKKRMVSSYLPFLFIYILNTLYLFFFAIRTHRMKGEEERKSEYKNKYYKMK